MKARRHASIHERQATAYVDTRLQPLDPRLERWTRGEHAPHTVSSSVGKVFGGVREHALPNLLRELIHSNLRQRRKKH